MLLTLATQAQFRIHSDGYTSFRTNSFVSWSCATLSHANDSVQKHWIVSFPRRTPNHTFFVTGEGNVYKNGTLTFADPGVISNESRINDAGLLLDNITGFYYTRNDEGNNGNREERKRRIGVSAQDIKEVLPDNPDSIPHHPLTLKANYGVDKYALFNHQHYGIPEWMGSDTMTIDYIKVYQLDWDCNTDEIISQQSELDSFDFAVKKSIIISSTIEPVSMGTYEKKTFRATDSFEITGPFQVNSGGEMTVIMQQCPE